MNVSSTSQASTQKAASDPVKKPSSKVQFKLASPERIKSRLIDLAIVATTTALGALAGIALITSFALPFVGIIIGCSAVIGAVIGISAILFRKNIFHRDFTKLSPEMSAIVDRTPKFNSYKISLPAKLQGLKDLVLTGLSLRPSNLFFQSMLGSLTNNANVTTMPGHKKLFAFGIDHDTIARHIKDKAEMDEVVKFSANGLKANATVGKSLPIDVDLEDIYGNNEYQISYKEIQETLGSQKIYVSSLLPLEFYRGFKTAMENDGVVELRMVRDQNGNIVRTRPAKLRDLLAPSQDNKAVAKFLSRVKNDPKKYGFKNEADFLHLLTLTTYQIGAMVVKSEDYHVFVDGNGKIVKREVGEKDAIRLLNICGIRPEKDVPAAMEHQNRRIMKENFKAAFAAAESGIVVVPAVGMGVWGGNPEVYWRAFLEAVVETDRTFDAILVNPNHAPSDWPNFKGKAGEEFATFLKECIDKNMEFKNVAPDVIKKLKSVHNLSEKKTDLVQLARELKKSYPEKVVSLLNASDPDVTLGNHVGEYTNNVPHGTTTEENYTAMGSNGLCFETITGVHHDLNRLFQVNKGDGKAVSAAELGLSPKRSLLGRIGHAFSQMADVKFS